MTPIEIKDRALEAERTAIILKDDERNAHVLKMIAEALDS